MKRIPQPPIQAASRSREAHGFWPGFVIALIGVILVLAGARRVTGVPTTQGEGASETELVKAFAHGGLQYASDQKAAPPPAVDPDPVRAAQAMQDWYRQQQSAKPTWIVRVDTTANTPCPT